MSTAVDTDTTTDLDINLDDEIPCEGLVDCPNVATWRETHTCCGAQANYCDRCKARLSLLMGIFQDGLTCNHCGQRGKPTWNRI